MDAIELLLTRQSTPRLIAPAPDATQLKIILDAAIRVPDHGALAPWEFIIATDQGLNTLAEIFVEAAKASGADEDFVNKAKGMPMRAPMVITVVAKTQQHPKVPVLEQQIAAGCATMAMQQAAFALGIGAVWRTGDFAFDANVNAALGLESHDQIVGFLYVGTPAVVAPQKPQKDGSQYVRYL
ncbi:Putative NAD(P)H nitroreductase ydjA [Shewanella baltica]|uniref:NAD(P)H nitroreductase n=1 Tax=Shewanella TaxID=22 RepID=UPI000D34C277|nr:MULTISPECIES: NAD(P)H nitroreductase [Shewanella]MCI2963995.1 NAD(P)H nitroreductase [Shewanella sp. N2AIL]VEF26429.1 Putative NAD(P)H nitroreductase ydjA [Shewanella baltica]